MDKTLKIILSLLTVLTTLAMLGLAVYGLFLPENGLILTAACGGIAVLLTPFLIKDYKFFFTKEGK